MRSRNLLKGFASIYLPILVLLFIVFGALVVIRSTSADVPTITGFGIVGDSFTDEYRAEDNRGAPYDATTFNAVELLAVKKGINLGVWGTRSEPRRSGYEYNWARSGATTSTLLSQGQHTGIAQQISQGKVSHVLFMIGSNDFVENNLVVDIYNGTISQANLDARISTMISNATTALNTIVAAGPAKVIVAGSPDGMDSIYMSNDFAPYFPDPVKRQRVSAAIASYNNQLKQVALSKGLVYVDMKQNVLDKIRTERANANGMIQVGSELIDPFNKGNEPHHVLLGDATAAHAGTVISGLIANELIITPLNTNFGFSIPLFTDSEVLVNAGIAVTPTPTAIPSPTVTPVPTVTATPIVTPTPTAVPTPTPTATPRPTVVPTPTPTVAPKTIKIVSKPNNSSQKYAIFDGIIENGSTSTEVTSTRFTYSNSWSLMSNQGVNNSPFRYTTTASKTVTFTTQATSLQIMTIRHSQVGSMQIYVNNVLKLTYNGNASSFQYANVTVPLN